MGSQHHSKRSFLARMRLILPLIVLLALVLPLSPAPRAIAQQSGSGKPTTVTIDSITFAPGAKENSILVTICGKALSYYFTWPATTEAPNFGEIFGGPLNGCQTQTFTDYDDTHRPEIYADDEPITERPSLPYEVGSIFAMDVGLTFSTTGSGLTCRLDYVSPTELRPLDANPCAFVATPDAASIKVLSVTAPEPMIHGSNAVVVAALSMPGDINLTLTLPDGSTRTYASFGKTTHQVVIGADAPGVIGGDAPLKIGETYKAAIVACAYGECDSGSTTFTTRKGMTKLYLQKPCDQSHVAITDAFCEVSPGAHPIIATWASGLDTRFVCTPQSTPIVIGGYVWGRDVDAYAVFVQALLDDAPPGAQAPAWVPREETYTISVPDFTQGALDDTPFSCAGQASRPPSYRTTLQGVSTNSGMVRSLSEAHQYVVYTPPIQQFDGAGTIVATPTSPDIDPASYSFALPANLVSVGRFAPTNEDGNYKIRYESDNKNEQFSSGLKDALIGYVAGTIPYIGPYVANALTAVNLAKLALTTPQNPTEHSLRRMGFSAENNVSVVFSLYSLAGVDSSGKTVMLGSGNDSQLRMYRLIVTKIFGEDFIIQTYWEDFARGAPIWFTEAAQDHGYYLERDVGDNTYGSVKGMSLQTRSPVNVVVTNEANQRVGKVPGGFANEISGTTYTTYPESDDSAGEIVDLPPGGTYQLAITGARDGTFGLDVVRYAADGKARIAAYVNVPIRARQVLNLTVPETTTNPILLPDGKKIWPIDVRPPSTQIAMASTRPPASGWYTAPVTVTVAASDDVTGVETTTCRVDREAPFTYKEPFRISRSGRHLVECASTDQVGNAEPPRFAAFAIDRHAPETRVIVRGARSRGVLVAPAEVVLDQASDGTSGVACVRYALDGADPQCYRQPLVVATNGTHQLTWFGQDNAGNVEAAQAISFTVNLDRPLAPAPVITFDPPAPTGAGGYYTGTVTATVTLAGGEAPRCSINGSNSFRVSGPIRLNDKGRLLRCAATDSSTARALPVYAAVAVDHSAPGASADAEGTTDDDGRFQSYVVWYLNGHDDDDDDDDAGVAYLEYQLDGGAWQRYDLPIVVATEGRHMLAYRAVDRAGNVGTTRTRTMQVRVRPR